MSLALYAGDFIAGMNDSRDRANRRRLEVYRMYKEMERDLPEGATKSDLMKLVDQFRGEEAYVRGMLPTDEIMAKVASQRASEEQHRRLMRQEEVDRIEEGKRQRVNNALTDSIKRFGVNGWRKAIVELPEGSHTRATLESMSDEDVLGLYQREILPARMGELQQLASRAETAEEVARIARLTGFSDDEWKPVASMVQGAYDRKRAEQARANAINWYNSRGFRVAEAAAASGNKALIDAELQNAISFGLVSPDAAKQLRSNMLAEYEVHNNRIVNEEAAKATGTLSDFLIRNPELVDQHGYQGAVDLALNAMPINRPEVADRLKQSQGLTTLARAVEGAQVAKNVQQYGQTYAKQAVEDAKNASTFNTTMANTVVSSMDFKDWMRSELGLPKDDKKLAPYVEQVQQAISAWGSNNVVPHSSDKVVSVLKEELARTPELLRDPSAVHEVLNRRLPVEPISVFEAKAISQINSRDFMLNDVPAVIQQAPQVFKQAEEELTNILNAVEAGQITTPQQAAEVRTRLSKIRGGMEDLSSFAVTAENPRFAVGNMKSEDSIVIQSQARKIIEATKQINNMIGAAKPDAPQIDPQQQAKVDPDFINGYPQQAIDQYNATYPVISATGGVVQSEVSPNTSIDPFAATSNRPPPNIPAVTDAQRAAKMVQTYRGMGYPIEEAIKQAAIRFPTTTEAEIIEALKK